MKKPTISIVIPALNEEKNVEAAIRKAIRLVEDRFSDYEVIIINDGSTDKTGEIIERLRKENKRVATVHHDVPKGFGASYIDGVGVAKYDYVSLVNGDNVQVEKSLGLLYDYVGQADIITPYTINMRARPFDRQVISNVFVDLMNFIFGLNLHYYTGASVIKTVLVKKLPMYTGSHMYMPSILIRLIKSGYSCIETPLEINESTGAKSKFFKIKNIINILREIIRLFVEVNISHRSEYNKKPKIITLPPKLLLS